MTKAVASRNINLLYWAAFLFGFRAYEGVVAVYIAVATDSFAIGMLYFALLNLSSSIFEVPTGLISDRIGRVKTLRLGLFFGIASVAVLAIITNAWQVILAAVFAGLSMSFRSGTVQAYIYENLEMLNQVDSFKKVYGKRIAIIKYSTGFSGLLGAIIIYFHSIQAALIVSLFFIANSLLVSFWLQDVRFREPKKFTILYDLKQAWLEFRSNMVLRNISLGRIIGTGVGNTEYRFRSLFFTLFMPDWLNNILGSLNNLLAGLFMQLAHRVVERFGFIKSLVLTELTDRVVTFFMILSNSFGGALVMNFVTSVVFGIRSVASEDLLQARYTKDQRATMGSFVGIASNIVYGAMAILTGLLADYIGLFYTMMLIQPVLLLVPFYFYRGVASINGATGNT